MDDLKKLTSEEAARFEQLVAAFTPITTTETPDYAELYFGEHRTQAMTMQPQDWLDFGKLLPKAVAAVNAMPELLALREENERLREALEEVVPLAESYLNVMPDKYGHNVSRIERARAALTPPANGTLGEIRARHDDENATLKLNFGVLPDDWATRAHSDRATLLPLAERCVAAEARVRELEAGLAPFVREHADFFGRPDENYYKMRVEIGALKRAAELLNASK